MHQENSALPEAATRHGIELESFAHTTSGGYVRRLTMPDGRWWFPAGDICKGLGLDHVRQALAGYVADSQHTTLGSVCALHRTPLPNQPAWTADLPLLTRQGVESLLTAPEAAEAGLFADWVRSTVAPAPSAAAALSPAAAAPRRDAIEISDFVYAATGARIRRLTMPDGTHWFPAADVSRHLGHLNTAKTVADHVPAADRMPLQGLTERYNVRIPAGRSWQKNMIMLNLQGLIALVSGSTKPEAAGFKRWVAEVVATIQRDGRYEFPQSRTIMVSPPAEPFPTAEFLSFLSRSEERQERMVVQLIEALAGAMAKPAPAPGPGTAPQILAGWRSRFGAPEEVWSVAAYVVPELLLHGELVAVGERIGARLGLTANEVHRCLGYLRRHGCIRQVGLTPGVGCPVYVFA